MTNFINGLLRLRRGPWKMVASFLIALGGEEHPLRHSLAPPSLSASPLLEYVRVPCWGCPVLAHRQSA